MKLYQKLALTFVAYQNCVKSNNAEWKVKHSENIETLIKDHFPHGAGIDDTVKFDFERSSKDELIFTVPYHCMNDGGYYDGWINYTLRIAPSLSFNFDLSLHGKDYNGSKEYLFDILQETLDTDLPFEPITNAIRTIQITSE